MTQDMIIFNSRLVTVAGFSNGPKKGSQMDDISVINDGAVFIKDGIIVAVGKTKDVVRKNALCTIDACGKVVMPGFVDCHTHTVFAGTRSHEYEAKIRGQTYEDQHGAGKGIFYTTGMTRSASETELVLKGSGTLERMIEYGTTTVEMKSGYGLDFKNEMKILRVINNLRNLYRHKITVVPTFLGAHTVPSEYKEKRGEYINLIISMLPAIKKAGLARFVDVFCDKIGFTTEESLKIFKEAYRLGFGLKVHLGQTGNNEGHRLLNNFSFASVDHLDYVDLGSIRRKDFIAVLLPGVTYHLMEIETKSFWRYRAQEFINGGIAVALATDYNPGSCPCFSMQTVMELAARLYRMTPAQIINAVTINAAHAAGRANEVGSIEVGKKADILICGVDDYREMINGFGTNKIEKVIKGGRIIVK